MRDILNWSIFWLLTLATALVGTAMFYVVYVLTHGSKPDAAVLGAFAPILGAVVWKGAVAIKNRNAPDKTAE